MSSARFMGGVGAGRSVQRSSVMLFDRAAENDSLVGMWVVVADDAAGLVLDRGVDR